MRDRLAQLQAAAAKFAEEQAEEAAAAQGGGVIPQQSGVVNEVRIEIEDENGAQPAAPLTEQEIYMAEFFDHVKEIRSMIDAISERVEELKRKQSKVLSEPQINDEIQQELDQIMLEIKQEANKIRTKLKLIEKSLSEEEEVSKASANYRIRKTQYNTMYRRLCDVLSDYNAAQTEFRKRCKATIKRQLEYTRKAITDDEVEEMIENGNAQAFTQGIIMDAQQARQMLRDVTSRHEDIKKLENSIKELYDMFMDMAMLIETQGEMIDRVEFNVNETAEYVEEALEQTEEALQMKRATRKKKCICCTALIIGIVVAIIITVVVVVVQICGNGACISRSSSSSDDPPKTPATPARISTAAPLTLTNRQTILRSLIISALTGQSAT